MFYRPTLRTRVAVLAVPALLCAAQAAAQSARLHAADPCAAVPPTHYQDAIAYHVEAAPNASPDRNWAQANSLAAATNSMALTMRAMSSGKSMAPMPSAPAPQPAPDVAQPHHAHHHHGEQP